MRSEQTITRRKWEQPPKCSENWILPQPLRQMASTRAKTMIGFCSEPKFVNTFVQPLKQVIKIKVLPMLWNRKLGLAVVENRQEFCWIVTVMMITATFPLHCGSLDQRLFGFAIFDSANCVFELLIEMNLFFCRKWTKILENGAKKSCSSARMGSDLSPFSSYFVLISFFGLQPIQFEGWIFVRGNISLYYTGLIFIFTRNAIYEKPQLISLLFLQSSLLYTKS